MTEKIYIQTGDKRVEAKGEQLEYILAWRADIEEKNRLIEAETKAKEEARQSAMDKLKKLGLTDEEIAALVP